MDRETFNRATNLIGHIDYFKSKLAKVKILADEIRKVPEPGYLPHDIYGVWDGRTTDGFDRLLKIDSDIQEIIIQRTLDFLSGEIEELENKLKLI